MNSKITQEFADSFGEAEKLFKENKFLESLRIYKILLKKKPEHVSVLNNIALIYERQGKFDEAISYYEKCNQILPHRDIFIHNLANIYCKAERYIDALPLLKKMTNLEHGNESNFEKLSICLFYTQTKKETKNFIELALAKFPNNILLNELLGKTLLHLSVYKDGIRYLQKGTGLIEFNDKGVKYLS